jgi:diguanylate cyclase (GGDEF)-like protein
MAAMTSGGGSEPGVIGETAPIDLDDPATATAVHIARLEATLEALREGLVLVGPDGRLERLNETARAMLGRLAGPMAQDPRRWLTHLRASRIEGLQDRPEAILARVLAGESVVDLRLHLRGPRATRTLSVNGQPLPPGCGGGAVFTVRDVTAEVESADALRREARRDPLTDLPNRRAFDEAVESAGSGDVVLLVDLERFKPVNDRYGHHVGDTVLLTLGVRLRVGVRAGDLAARVGGDEFAVLLRRVQDDEVGELAERVRALLERPIEAEGVLIQVGASIGTTRVRAGEDPSGTMRRVDEAMYIDKRSRRQAGGRLGPGAAGAARAAGGAEEEVGR